MNEDVCWWVEAASVKPSRSGKATRVSNEMGDVEEHFSREDPAGSLSSHPHPPHRSPAGKGGPLLLRGACVARLCPHC